MGKRQDQSVVGWPRQKTASADPPSAMKTTLTAAGTATMMSGKCFCARAKPRAALCMPAAQDSKGFQQDLCWAGLHSQEACKLHLAAQ